MSLPARGRGSKHAVCRLVGQAQRRSPHGGVDRNLYDYLAYTPSASRSPHGGVDRNVDAARVDAKLVVAPRTGAWIETSAWRPSWALPSSLPARGRGSKQRRQHHHARGAASLPARGRGSKHQVVRPVVQSRVAPRTGAWIETPAAPRPPRSRQSLPARGRGSKRAGRRRPPGLVASLPARGRGSKRERGEERADLRRRSPHGGVDRNQMGDAAWAARGGSLPARGRGSKPVRAARRAGKRCRSPHGGVDRNLLRRLMPLLSQCRSPHGGVDRNTVSAWSLPREPRRSPHGGVDRNPFSPQLTSRRRVAPRTGAWIETRPGRRSLCRSACRSPHGGVDRNPRASSTQFIANGRSPHGGVDRNICL